ncbi:MAG: NUDIX hydrolase [Pirellula sp.]|jgi:ADP-ribose pyrophosphatase
MKTPKKLYQAKRFAVEEVYEQLPDGTEVVRNVVRHPGAVVILPLVDDDHVCLIHTYRAAINKWNLELPAGTLDKSLPPLDVAFLELKEETGYEAGQMDHVHTFNMSPGILDEKMHFYVASQMSLGDTAREIGEQMENRVVCWSEVDRMLRDRQIIDAKTLVCLLWYLRYRKY